MHALPSPASSFSAAAAAGHANGHDDFFFSLVSASGVSVRFRVTPHMCAHSLYLHSAREVAAADGAVPVGSTQAIHDYIAYMQYSDLREQLAAELARSPAVHDRIEVPVSAKPAAPLFDDPAADENSGVDHEGGVYLPELVAPPLWEDPGLVHAEGARGYVVQPLDCDRAYAEHAAQLRHWFTAAELSSLRGDASAGTGAATATPATASSSGGARPRSHPRSPASTASPSPPHAAVRAATHLPSAAAGPSTAEPLPPPAFPPVESGPRRGQGRPRQRRYSFMPSSSTSSSSSVSSSVTSTPGLASSGAQAGGSAAEGSNAAPSPPLSGGRRAGMCETLGYGEYVALDMPDGMFFMEHVLLPERAPRAASASTKASTRHLPGRDVGDALLSAAQQCRLLELIAVADFMGTQPLVELCATYLAAWLMDHTEEDLVASFLAPASPAGPASELTSALPQANRFRLTGATALTEPWIVAAGSSHGVGLAGAAPASPLSAAPGAAGGSSATGGNAALGAAPSNTTKKKGAASTESKQAGKQRGKAPQGGATPPDAGGHDGLSGSATVTVADPTAATTVAASALPCLLSGDQRLALLRQMKRDNSIMVTPY